MNRDFLILTCTALAFVGCARAKLASDAESQKKLATSYAELTKTFETHHAGLQDELARLQAEGALPLQLVRGQNAGEASEAKAFTAALVAAFSAKELEFALREAAQPLAKETLPLAPLELERARHFRARFAAAQSKTRGALARFTPRLSLDLPAGALADLSPLDAVRVAVRLEAIAAAEGLAAGNTEETLEALSNMAQLTDAAAHAPNLTARLSAASMRADQLAVIRAIAEVSPADREALGTARDTLQRQLNSWPAASDVLIAERAQGLHTCEMVRDGQLLSLLSEEQLAKQREEIHLWTLNSAVMRGIDDDEFFYLTSMRRLVDASSQPLAEQLHLLAQIRGELDEKRPTPRHPFVAETFLLTDLDSALETLAEDRARCDAWSLALASMLGETPAMAVSPIDGQAYSLRVLPSEIKVSHAGEELLRVPMRR